MFFEYEKATPSKRLEDYCVVKGDEIFIPPDQWLEMVENFSRTEIIDHLSVVIEGLPFPYTKYTEEEVRNDWTDLLGDQNLVVRGVWHAARCELSVPNTYLGGYYYINSRSCGQKVSNQYAEPVRMSVDHVHYKSPYKEWTREGCKSKTRFVLRVLWTLAQSDALKNGVGSRQLRDCLRVANYMAAQFKPSIAKSVYDFFGAKKVLDFSMGWGDRLVGFHASGAESYVGIDPNTKLHAPYAQITDYCATGKTTRFICAPAEDADLSGVEVDFVFTSPPYFDTERYSEEETQSWKRYPDVGKWLEGFLFPVLTKCWGALSEGGRIAVNISDKETGNYRVCQPMIEFMAGLGAVYEGTIGYRMAKRPGSSLKDDLTDTDVFCEPIFIWSKGAAPEPRWKSDNFFGV